MVVTRRTQETENKMYSAEKSASVALLERVETQSYTAPAVPKEEQSEQARERMQKNLDKLLNYDRYAEQVAEPVAEVQSFTDDDITPTSTTMQFGNGDLDTMYQERAKAENKEKEGYYLNSKGKVVIALYALAVTIIMALIVLNTGILAKLSNTYETKAQALNQKAAEYSAIVDNIDSISSNDYVIEYAQNELGMIKR